ncbi:MAG: LysR family transcriptional regulator [Alphaproteobacteria bacterium]|nr:LysR family transcriptional regulator [Alphaproteobacteria bacterium]
MPTLNQLRSLVVLAETLHFHRAAERRHVSQPALSNQIAQLEQALGVPLVERTRRRVLLTPVGREVAERAKVILRDVEDLKEVTRQARAPLSGTLRLGVLPTLGPYLLPHILPGLRRRFPDLRLYLREEPAGRLLPELAHGELDLVLAAPQSTPEGLVAQPLFAEPFWVALPLGHALAERPALAVGDLAGERLLTMDQGHCLRDQALELCRRAGAAEHPDFRATSLDSLRQMVATGVAPTLLPGLYVRAEALADTEIVMRPFAPPAPHRTISLLWRRSGTRAADYRLFAQLVQDGLPDAVSAPGTPLHEA